MYFADIDPASGELLALEIVPMQIQRFRLNPASEADIAWTQQTLDRECGKFGGHIAVASAGRLALSWPKKTRGMEFTPPLPETMSQPESEPESRQLPHPKSDGNPDNRVR